MPVLAITDYTFPSLEIEEAILLAATIYQTLGLPKTIAWKDSLDRPHHVYHGEPIRGLS